MKKKKQSAEDIAWRKGYDLGMQTTLQQNDIALRIGRAVLDAMDSRYEFKKEDYD